MKKIYTLAVLSLLLAACNSKENLDPNSVIKDEIVAQTDLDTFIYENFQHPYNIIVNYNWIDSDFEQRKYLYPPTESKVKPLLEIVKKVWIDAYRAIAGENFMKEVAPRQISLVGGYNVNTSGTITLGIADSGMKITLFNVDMLNTGNHTETREYFHTIQHEYCHIINQKKPFSTEYSTVTPQGYTANWFNVTDENALAMGFITPYATMNEKEDFAEMVAAMLEGSKEAWDARIEAVTNETGKAALRRKEALIVTYFKNEWNIDFYQLQAKVEEQMLSVLQ